MGVRQRPERSGDAPGGAEVPVGERQGSHTPGGEGELGDRVERLGTAWQRRVTQIITERHPHQQLIECGAPRVRVVPQHAPAASVFCIEPPPDAGLGDPLPGELEVLGAQSETFADGGER